MIRHIGIIFIVLTFLFVPLGAFAGFGDGVNVNLITRLDASKDNITWYNYLSEINSGGKTLVVAPGDDVNLQLNTWNAGNNATLQVTFLGQIDNSQYLESESLFAATDSDLDNDTNQYSVSSYDGSTGQMNFTNPTTVGSGSATSGNQLGSMSVKVKSDTPNGTLIVFTVTITDYNPFIAQRLLDSGVAHADSNATTIVRVLVQTPTTTEEPAITELPVTGINNNIYNLY